MTRIGTSFLGSSIKVPTFVANRLLTLQLGLHLSRQIATSYGPNWYSGRLRASSSVPRKPVEGDTVPTEPVVKLSQLLDAGVHFGHQTRRWNPKMRRFIYGEKNGIYIIDLRKTLVGIEAAYRYTRDLANRGGIVLFVGTKKQTQDPIAEYAIKTNMPYINQRWLGGMLTNFQTILGRVKKMRELEELKAHGGFDAMPKKEALLLSRELEKLQTNLGGIRNLTRLPDAIFVIDTKKEHIAVTEANKLRIPIIAVVDTNCDPDLIQYVIPGNDDAIRAGQVMCKVIADAIVEGRQMVYKKGLVTPAPAAPTPEPSVEVTAEEASAPSEPAIGEAEVAAEVSAPKETEEASTATTSPEGVA